jgi:hypothetical protein
VMCHFWGVADSHAEPASPPFSKSMVFSKQIVAFLILCHSLLYSLHAHQYLTQQSPMLHHSGKNSLVPTVAHSVKVSSNITL